MSDDLLADLRSDEGWQPHVYKDSLGLDTIGYGFLLSVGLPQAVGEFWLQYAINERLEELQRLWPGFKNQPAEVQRAVGNMAYQIGPAGVLKFKRMLAALDAGDRATAAEEALDSEWSIQTPQRAARVAAMIRGT